MATDSKGNDLKVGCEVAVAGQGEIYTGVIVQIRDNNTAAMRRCEERIADPINGRYKTWAQKYIDECQEIFKIRKDSDGKFMRIENFRRLLVI